MVERVIRACKGAQVRAILPTNVVCITAQYMFCSTPRRTDTQDQHLHSLYTQVPNDRGGRASARYSPSSSNGAHLRAINCTPGRIRGCPGGLKQVVLGCSEP